jgi:hypothetical protein
MVGDWVLNKTGACGGWASAELASGELFGLASVSPPMYDYFCFPADSQPSHPLNPGFASMPKVPKTAAKFGAVITCNGEVSLIINVWQMGFSSSWTLLSQQNPPIPYGQVSGGSVNPCSNVKGSAILSGSGNNSFYWTRNFSWKVQTTPFV